MVLIIAYGNDLREDDGAGLLLAKQLTAALQDLGIAVRHIAVQQLMPELAVDIAREDVSTVVFVDARPGTLPDDRHVLVAPIDPTGESTPSLGHHFLPDVLMLYASVLSPHDPLPPAWLVTIPGVAFGYGQGISDVARNAIQSAFDDQASQLRRLIAKLSIANRAAAARPDATKPPT